MLLIIERVFLAPGFKGIFFLSILEAFVQSRGYEYRRLDGTTPNEQRSQLVDEFNQGFLNIVLI